MTDFLSSLLDCKLEGSYSEGSNTAATNNSSAICMEYKDVLQCQQQTVGYITGCNSTDMRLKLQNKCHIKLNKIRECWLHKHVCEILDSDEQMQAMWEYQQCLGYNYKVQECVNKLKQRCEHQRLRVIRLHRLDIDTLENIINKLPDVFVVFYVKDPRSLVLNKHNIQHLCTRMQTDYIVLSELISRYPGVIRIVKHEDFITQPELTIQDLYSHIQEENTTLSINMISNAIRMIKSYNNTYDDNLHGVDNIELVRLNAVCHQVLKDYMYHHYPST